MRIIKNFKQADEELNKYISQKTTNERYTLDRMRALMNYLNNPQNKLKIIHVAGTSGKTSTCYYIASLLHEVGHKVGLTISPHVDNVSERAQIDMSSLPESDFCHQLGIFLDLIDKSKLRPSYFEVMVAFAFWIFDKYSVEYAVVEVGVGGLLDGTNVINRDDKICVITDIGLDHVEILGNTIEQIAAQKAGIIQNNNIVFMNPQDDKIASVVKRVCMEKNTVVNINAPGFGGDILKTLSMFQKRNFELALQVVRYALNRDFHQVIEKGEIDKVKKIVIPARMEIFSYHGKKIIIDGSHNEQKIRALVNSMIQQFHNEPLTLMVSFGNNKQSSVKASLVLLRKLSSKIILTEFGNGQDEARVSIKVEELAKYAQKNGFNAIISEPDPKKAFDILVKSPESTGLVTGSFYLLNNIRPILSAERSKP